MYPTRRLATLKSADPSSISVMIVVVIKSLIEVDIPRRWVVMDRATAAAPATQAADLTATTTAPRRVLEP